MIELILGLGVLNLGALVWFLYRIDNRLDRQKWESDMGIKSFSREIECGVSNAFNNMPVPESVDYGKLSKAIENGIVRAKVRLFNAELEQEEVMA